MSSPAPCPQCSAPLYGDDVYCPACGLRREESVLAGVPVRGATRAMAALSSAGEEEAPVCPACGAPFLPRDTFCALCGEPVGGGEGSAPGGGDRGGTLAAATAPVGIVLESATPAPAVSVPAGLVADEATPAAAPGLADRQPEADGWHEVRLQLEAATRGEFEIIRGLGRGGMAAVFLARDLTLGREVAIKVMAPGLLLGPGMVDRFRQEAVTIARLHHPNIVTIHRVGQAGTLHYFVMQFVEGASLEGILARLGSVPIHLAQVILYQLGVGLSYAHRRGIVHRDIKPGNALLDLEGNAILTDFGIAKVTTATNLTQTGATIGTPAYMSPEQCRAGELSGASDQYSLGVLAYEMLTGSPPFSGSPFEIMQAHTATPPPSIREQRPDCPPDLEAAVLRMLAKDPGDRFPTVAEAIEAVGGYLPGPQDPIREELAYLVDPARGSLPAPRAPFTPVPGRAAPATPPGGSASLGAPRQATTAAPAGGSAYLPAPSPPRARFPLRAGAGVAVVVAGVALGVFLWPGRDGGGPPIEPSTPSEVSRIAFPNPSEEVLVGTSLRVVASLLDAQGQAVAGQAVAWASDQPGIATVEGATEEATVTGLAPGQATVRARVGDLEGIVTIVVAAPGAGEFRVSAPGRELVAGSQMALTAILTDQNGERIPDPEVAWSSSDPGILGVDARSGVVTGAGLGRAQIRATAGKQTRTLELSVIGRVESLAVGPPDQVLRAPGSAVLKATVRSVPQGYLGVEGIRWSSANPAVATVAYSQGDSVVLALLIPGETVVTAVAEGFQSAVTLRVQATAAAVTVGLSQPVVTFEAEEQGEAPADQTVTVTVTGEATPTLGAVRYSGSASGWLSPLLGTTAGAQTGLVLRAGLRGVAAGEYSARLPVRAGDVSQELEVRLVVAPNPGAGPLRPDAATAQALAELLGQYQAAVTAKNANRVREIFPSLPQAALNELVGIRATDTYYLQLVPGSLRLGAREGTLEGDVMSGVIPPGGGRGELFRMIYTFGRRGRGWYIESFRPGS